MFGGMNSPIGNTNQLHVFDIKSNTWTQCHTKSSPPPTDSHKACIYNSQMIVAMGFVDEDYTSDICSLDLKTLKWSKIFDSKK